MAVKERKKQAQGNITTMIKDAVIYTIALVVLAIVIVSNLWGLPLNEWGDALLAVFADLVIYLLGIIGIFEFGYDNGLTVIVPSSFMDYKERRLEKQMKETLHAFFDKESEYLRCHEDDRMADTLSLMGLSTEGYREVQAKVVEARLAPMYDVESARKKLMDLVFHSNSVIDMHKDAEHISSANLRYYMKIHDLMHNSCQSDLLARIMATFIRLTCEEQGIRLADVDAIMVPHSSNFLLGLDVSKLLGKGFIKMIIPEKIVGNYCYEGVIPPKTGSRKYNIVIVHDVLLSGRQIYESVNKLRDKHPDCQIVGLFSLIYRNVYNGKEDLEQCYDIKCYNVLEMTEEDIERELERRGKA